MPNILKRFTRASNYVLPNAEDIRLDDEPAAAEPVSEIPEPPQEVPMQEPVPRPVSEPQPSELDYARLQAEAIAREAQREAEELKQKILDEAREQAQKEAEDLRRDARSEGFNRGFAEGMAKGMSESRDRREEEAAKQVKEVQAFLETAARDREQLLDQTKEEMKDLALTVAEKVIRVSLKSSSDILLRMIESATERYKRREWAHVYIAGCDAKAMAYTIPELASSLSHVSDRVRVIPMADDESGTCIIEFPDQIIDASISTQMDNIREIASHTELDKDGG